MKIRCIAIDDEPLALQQIAGYIKKTPFLELVYECNNAFEAMEALSKNEVDLIFADINMPDLSGLDLIKSMDQRPEVIFATAYSEYAVEGFKVDALDYLLKPIGYDDFLKAANKAKNHIELQASKTEKLEFKDQNLFIKSEHKIVRINHSDINYIEGMREYVRKHLANGKPIMTLISMKKLEESLPEEIFMRVHRSYIVNLHKITTIERSRIIFGGNVYIPVSEQYKKRFQDYVNKHFLM